jgi:hypothetical protein
LELGGLYLGSAEKTITFAKFQYRWKKVKNSVLRNLYLEIFLLYSTVVNTNFIPLQDCWVKILSLTGKSLINAGFVCKLWNNIASKEYIERGMYKMEITGEDPESIKDFTR